MMEPRQYTTERGITVGVMPIPMLLDEIRKAHPFPKRPTYTEHLAGGATQEVEITDKDAANWAKNDPDTWAEHAEKWAAYGQERDEVQEKLNDRLWQAVMRRALIVELPEDDGWIQDQEMLGLTVPKDAREQRVHYIRTEVIGGMRDVLRLTAIANGSDLSEEAVSLAETSFRHSLARALIGRLADQAGALEPGDAGGADEDGEGLEPETE